MTTDDALEQLLNGGDADASNEHLPALGWVRADTLGTETVPPGKGKKAPDLLARRPRKSRAPVVLPILGALVLAGAYASTTLLWPTESIPLTVADAPLSELVAPAATPPWPAEGSAAVAVDGLAEPLTTTADAASIASITKVVTALLVLDRMPLAPGEQGPAYEMTEADQEEFLAYLARDESALDVPVYGALTQYQMLQGMLIGSAGNYASRLAAGLWDSNEAFAQAAQEWLAAHGIEGITVVEPTGIDPANAATPAALLALAHAALDDPVLAEIVRTPVVELPGAGTVHNTNDLLADPAVIGVKTGSLEDQYGLLAAKAVTVGDDIVHVYAVALGQPDDESRDEVTAALLDQTAAEVAQPATVAAGTVVADVRAPWGASTQAITDADAAVVLWNGGTATTEPEIDIAGDRAAGARVGSFVVTGPLGTAKVPVRLTTDIPPPTPVWRLTHPLEVFGIVR